MNAPVQSATPTALIPPPAQPLELPGSPLGIAWFIVYGQLGVPTATFMPALRELGSGFAKVYGPRPMLSWCSFNLPTKA
jgi:hypothetical protein